LKFFQFREAQRFGEKFSVSPHQLSVEVNFPASVILALDADHIPVHLAAITVISFLVGLDRE
jgi:hypothetical protein